MFDWTDSLPDERPPGKVCVPLQLQQGVAGEGEEPGDPTPGSKQVTRQSARLARQEQLFRYLCRQPCICAWWQGCLGRNNTILMGCKLRVQIATHFFLLFISSL